MTACEERTKLKQETAVQTKREAVTQRDGSIPAEEEQRGSECSGGEDKNEKVRTKNSAVATNEDKYHFSHLNIGMVPICTYLSLSTSTVIYVIAPPSSP